MFDNLPSHLTFISIFRHFSEFQRVEIFLNFRVCIECSLNSLLSVSLDKETINCSSIKPESWSHWMVGFLTVLEVEGIDIVVSIQL